MVIVSINNTDYSIYQDWNEVTVSKAREISEVCSSIPETLASIYKEKSKGDQSDKDQLRILELQLNDQKDNLIRFYSSVLVVLSDIPNDIVSGISSDALTSFYENFLYIFVFESIHYPIRNKEVLSSVYFMEKNYKAPETKNIMGVDRPFFNQPAAVFCDASDAYSNSISQGNKYLLAELVTSIVYREDSKKYNTDVSLLESGLMKDIITCDVYHSAISHLSSVNHTLKQLFPNLYQKGNPKSNMASKESGLSDFGWMSSIMSVAKSGVLNISGLTPLESVRQTNMYDFMTVLSNMRADSDYQKVYSEKVKK